MFSWKRRQAFESLCWLYTCKSSLQERDWDMRCTYRQISLECNAVLLRVKGRRPQLAVQIPLQPVRKLDAAVVCLVWAAQPL